MALLSQIKPSTYLQSNLSVLGDLISFLQLRRPIKIASVRWASNLIQSASKAILGLQTNPKFDLSSLSPRGELADITIAVVGLLLGRSSLGKQGRYPRQIASI